MLLSPVIYRKSGHPFTRGYDEIVSVTFADLSFSNAANWSHVKGKRLTLVA
ncbi:hypothetical protein ACQKDS_16730 [Serratia sp. NPDC078593]|uniref:hypothetical protein n=1 Tax=unclassified Serratia (in: enterobacteria) TaxID=2647522 RepID=UPI0037D73E52